jgi:hypothetical protein
MWMLALSAVLVVAPDVQVQTLSGKSLSGSLVELTDEKLIVQSDAGPVTLATSELMNVAPQPAAEPAAEKPGVWVELTDQSKLVGATFTAAKGAATVKLLSGETVEVPTRAIATVRFKDQDAALARQWAEILAADRSGDLIVIRKNDALDYLAGVVKEVSADAVQFELDGEVVAVKRPKVEGLVYHAPAAELTTPKCLVFDNRGSRFAVRKMSLADGALQIVTPAGMECTLPLALLARLDYSMGNVQYLSDLKPESAKWSPYFGGPAVSPEMERFYRPRMDRNLEGGPLRLAGNQYAKGIALHSRSELVFRLPEQCSSFQALAGIDDRLRGSGDVRLQVFGDDRTLFDEAISGNQPPRELKLEIKGVNRLRIVVDFGGDLDVADHLNLCDARILK